MGRQIDGGDIKFSFTGDSSDLNEALQKADKNLGELVVSSQGAANKLDKNLGKAAKKSRDGIKDFADTAGDADSSLMGMAGALDMINPALGDMARTTGDALAGIEGASKAAFFANPVFMGLATAAGAVALAYVAFTAEAEAAAEAQKIAKKRADDLSAAYDTLGEFLLQTALDYAVFNGTLDETEAAIRRAAAVMESKYTPVIELHREEMERLSKEIANQTQKEIQAKKIATEQIKLLQATGESKEDIAKKTFVYTEAYKNEVATRKELQAAYGVEHRALKKQEEDLETVIEKKTEMIKGEKALVEAKEKTNEARKKEKDFLDLVEEARVASLSTKEKLEEAMEREIELLDEAFEKETESAELAQTHADTKLSIETRYAEQIAEIERQAQERKDSFEQKNLAAIERRTELELRAAKQVAAEEQMRLEKRASYMIGFTNSMSEFMINMNERNTEDSEKAALKSFYIGQVAAMAEIAVNTAVAATAAMKQTGNPLAAAPAVAFGLMQGAAVLAEPPPTFHSGGIVSAPDEVDIRAQTGEGIINRTGMDSIGPDGLAAINRGQSTQQVQVQMVFRHKIFDEFVVSNLKRSNSPLRNAIRKGGVSRGLLV